MYNAAHHHHNKPVAAPSPESAAAADIFEQLCAASTFKSVLHHYRHLCDVLKLKPTNIKHFYPKLKSKLRSWKAQALWSKFDKRASHKCYNHGKPCQNSKVLIIGAGPCGLRTAIEAQLLGAKVVVVEKRDRFSRNNVLHLWPFVINDLKQLGAKKFYGKFCAGAIDHISIRQLQCILLKVALLLGVEVFENVGFEELIEPPEDQTEKVGWRARLGPPDHPANQYEFDVLIGADGKRNTLSGFKRKEFRGKLAIAITANFINRRSEAEARVQEISGVAFIFNQKFFKELYAATGIDLENIVYYKDETHYFVMTAKKHSLLDKGVILQDLQDTQQLLHPSNVDKNALLDYAREAADFSTSYQLPHLDFAVNHYGKPDIAMFDFTSMFAAENACRIIERRGYKLLAGLVGDSLLEPFWPTGSGCARGFLSSFDAAWMIRTWASEKATPLEVLAERESIYRLLAQTTPENLGKDHNSYTLEPMSRYPTINVRAVLPFQVRNLFDTDDLTHLEELTNPHLVSNDDLPKKRKRRDSLIHPDTLLVWCKKQVALYDSIRIENMSTSFKDGRVLCAIIHHYRPDLLDFASLRPENIAENNQLAFDILEREFGVPPVMTGLEMAECDVPDKLSMISYASQIFDVFRGEIPHYKYPKMDDREMEVDKIAPSAPSSTPHFNILKNLTNKTANTTQGSLASKKRPTTDRGSLKRDDGLITCHVLEDVGVLTGDRKNESLKKTKKRKSERVTSPIETSGFGETVKPLVDPSMDFNDKVKDLEAKFIGTSHHGSDRKPKDLIRRVGKIEKSDWNIAAIEKKMHESAHGADIHVEREKVPKWSKDVYEDKFQNIEKRLRENGEDEETIAKYKDIDASLKRLEMKLREGSTLETGMRGQNKVSNLASQLSSKLEKKETEKIVVQKPTRPTVPLPTSGSDLCHFCGNRVYLVERLSAEGKFFHRQCFKCDYCAANLRLGNYIYDRDGRYGGKFFCIPHYGLSPRERGLRRKTEDTDSAKENIVPTSTSTPSSHLHMRNGPQTWPLCGHEFLDWLHPSDGEISPRQYTALIRRASSLHYRPKSLSPVDIPKGYHPLDINAESRNTSEETVVISKHQRRNCTSKNTFSNKQNTKGPNHTKTLTGISVESVNNRNGLTKIAPTKCKKSSGSLKSKSNNMLSCEFSKLKISSTPKNPGRQNKPNLYLKLANGTHMSESSDFHTKEQTDTSNRKVSRLCNKELARGIGSHGKPDPRTTRLKPSSQVSSANNGQSIHVPRVPISEKQSPLTAQTGFGSLGKSEPRTAHLKTLCKSSSSNNGHSVHSSSVPISETQSPLTAQMDNNFVTERPYYDCGYDTDYDSTPPHSGSGSECDDGKLKLILDSSPVWSRYMAWLERMTKTQL